ncbi:hypothetical protein Y032_0545g3247 [Ancylostoma ceylanicum]|uniref:Uncharacterized protein n=1 Tax=Ancylostoma ceylanicum TaxID=53326 RepID=A0A016WQK8_9BILA|nr:hypothetical protein Y032_0545g3247 [Ancylostoma ceylanicum]
MVLYKGWDRGAVLLRVSAQQARCLGAADNQSARAAVPAFVYDRLEFTVRITHVEEYFELLTLLDIFEGEFSDKRNNN